MVVAVVTMMMFVVAGVGVGGCTAPEGPRTVDSRFLSQKVPAIKGAAQQGDKSVVPKLVADLDSDDAAVRFYAIEGLERLTGQTFGYIYYDGPERRREPVLKWRQWLNDQQP